MNKELHVISNGKMPLESFLITAQKVYPYVTAIHIREKNLDSGAVEHWARKMINKGIPKEKVILNHFIHLAASMDLAGVQLPTRNRAEALNSLKNKKSYPRLRIGVSVHQLSEARYYEEQGADYLLFGNVYETDSKPGLAGRGIAELQEIAQSVSIPVIAIGGIHADRVASVLAAGASGIAVMSGVMDAHDPAGAARQFYQLLS